MGKFIFITGGCYEPKAKAAIRMFEDEERAEYLCTGITDISADQHIRFLESTGHSEWRTRNAFDLDIDDIDTDVCGNSILDSLSDWVYRIVSREPENTEHEYFTRRVESEVLRLLSKIREADGSLIILSDDASRSVIPSDEKLKLIQRVLCSIDFLMSEISDETYIIEMGIMRQIK